MTRPVHLALALAPLLACARTSRPDTAPPVADVITTPGDLTWRPGDSRPVARDIVRATPPPEGPVQPILLDVELRNRCPTPATFVVARDDTQPGPDAPSNTLAPGEAIDAGLYADECVYLQTAGGPQRACAARWIVFTGQGACDQATAIAR
jgi:hypothetical protein